MDRAASGDRVRSPAGPRVAAARLAVRVTRVAPETERNAAWRFPRYSTGAGVSGRHEWPPPRATAARSERPAGCTARRLANVETTGPARASTVPKTPRRIHSLPRRRWSRGSVTTAVDNRAVTAFPPPATHHGSVELFADGPPKFPMTRKRLVVLRASIRSAMKASLAVMQRLSDALDSRHGPTGRRGERRGPNDHPNLR